MAKYAIIGLILCFALKTEAQINPSLRTGVDLQLSAYKYLSNSDFTAFKSMSYDTIQSGYFLFNKTFNDWDVHLSPNYEMFASTNHLNNIPLFGAGVYTRVAFRDKIKIGVDFTHYQGNLPEYQRRFVNDQKIYPGAGVVNNVSGQTINFNYHNLFLSYKTNKYLTLSAGIGRQFIGDGYRSLIRSDYQNASPFLKIKTKFWNIEYTNLFESHYDINNVEYSRNSFRRKFTASHFLDWKVSKWLTLGLFETVVWQNDDGQFTRGIDPNYLNPFIFYRPIEFSTGSSDNVIVGSNLKFTILKKQILYSQIVLDEFLLAELKADFDQYRNPNQNIQSGWWANKYAIQLGWRSLNILNIKGLESRVEYNMARPFTYAHSSPMQSYANSNMSLAHPLGANFEEYILSLQYVSDSWSFKAYFNHYKQGRSLPGTNYGDDVQFSNSSRISEYENGLLQGNLNAVDFLDLSASRLLYKKTNTSLQLGFQNRSEQFLLDPMDEVFLYLKVSSSLHATYFDF